MKDLVASIVANFRDAVANKTLRVATALGLAVTVAVAYGIWLDWEWKAMIGWRALEGYIDPDPDDTTGKKDAVQVYAVIVAGVIASITAFVGLLNLRLTRKNLEQQRELEAQRAEQQRELAQGTALQAFYEQIGKLLTEYDLRNTKREDIRELARGQTLTVLQEVDWSGKGSLLTFLYAAGLIEAEKPAVALTGADLEGADLRGADLRGAGLQGARLQEAKLQEAKLQRTNLQEADLRGADLREANLTEADLTGSSVQRTDLQGADPPSRPGILDLGGLLLLRGADLRGADLRKANLREADLREADLRGRRLELREGDPRRQLAARLQGADLRGADLLGAKVTDAQLDATWSLQGATMPEDKNP